MSAAAITAVALIATAIVWRTVAGHVHPERVIVGADGASDDAPMESSAPGGPGGAAAVVAGQAAVGVSVEVQ